MFGGILVLLCVVDVGGERAGIGGGLTRFIADR